MATALVAKLNGCSQIHLTTPKFLSDGKPPSHRSPSRIPAIFANKRMEELEENCKLQQPIQTSRRMAIGLAASAALLAPVGGSFGSASAEEENNGYWLTGPLPVPTVTSKIANEETRTRSFLRNGIYMANIGADGSSYRLRECAFDLLALGDLMGQDAWSHMRRYLCLKSTFMYYDFDTVISAAPADQKQPLTDLANSLFDSFEKLEDAIKKRDDPAIESCYANTTPILQEVRARMV